MQKNSDRDHIFHAIHPVTIHRGNELRTLIVVILTLITMVVEIVAGILTGSMALLSDGWHMGTHAGALGIALFAYVYSRKYAEKHRYSFGSGKIGILAAFTSAIVLGLTGILILYESVWRLINPISISFDHALLVAVIGLVVNFVCAWILGSQHDSHHEHHHHHADETEPPSAHQSDYNNRAAFLHVIADMLTSVFAIGALLIGKYYGFIQLDSLAGLLGGTMILWWAFGLLGPTCRILLDGDVEPEKMDEILNALQKDSDDQILDLHVWRISENDLAVIVALIADHPRPPEYYHALLKAFFNVKHVTVEIHREGECDFV